MKKQRPVSNQQVEVEEEIDFLQIVRGLALFCAAIRHAGRGEGITHKSVLWDAKKYEDYILLGTTPNEDDD